VENTLRKKLIDILACPMCGHYPLKLIIIEESDDKVVQGILHCQNCGRWYPIRDEIAVMLPDNMRDQKKDDEFYTKYEKYFKENGITKSWQTTEKR